MAPSSSCSFFSSSSSPKAQGGTGEEDGDCFFALILRLAERVVVAFFRAENR
jgi:hypothetical protein